MSGSSDADVVIPFQLTVRSPPVSDWTALTPVGFCMGAVQLKGKNTKGICDFEPKMYACVIHLPNSNPLCAIHASNHITNLDEIILEADFLT